jgi:hypothetical protein
MRLAQKLQIPFYEVKRSYSTPGLRKLPYTGSSGKKVGEGENG